MNHAHHVQAVTRYLEQVAEVYASGIAREHAYRPAQIQLLNAFDDAFAINDAAKSSAGFPDFTILRRSKLELARGYGEGKDVTENLDRTTTTKQFTRYLEEYGNIFLTNAIEFRFFRAGEQLGPPLQMGSIDRSTGALSIDYSSAPILADAIESFLTQPPETLKSAPRLSIIMAGKARVIRALVNQLLDSPQSAGGQSVDQVYKLVRDTLSPEMSPQEFADMYAQTMVYGLFAARFHDESLGNFSRQEARDLIAHESDFLKSFFDHIAGASFPDDLKVVVNDLCEIFSVSDVRTIVRHHLREAGEVEGKDPIIHFYELFLREYDADQKKDRGVYYTPAPVVRYIIRAVDNCLMEHFGIQDGIADNTKKGIRIEVGGAARNKSRAKRVLQPRRVHRVQILDPAVGTATFLNEVIRYIHRQFEGQAGLWPSYARDDLVPRLFGFELMMAPYSIAHLKLGMTLAELEAPHAGKMNVFLTNTLDEPAALNPDLLAYAGLAGAFTREATMAAEVKVENPVMVVMGNPPYSGHSENRSTFANSLVDKYKVEPGGGAKLNERNSKWLLDDYVKFIAFSEALIARNPDGGIMAMITNNGYLDNPTFRGMRWHLAKTFDFIDVIDLHGSAKKRDSTPEERDVNVFDIQQGVSIIVAARVGKGSSRPARVRHADLKGSRADKFHALDNEELEFTAVDLDPKFYFFQPRSSEGREEHYRNLALSDIFYKSVIGLFTGRDKLTIDMDREQIESRVADFRNGDPEEMRVRYKLGKDVRDWSVQAAQDDLNRDFSEDRFVPIAYRPFDRRWTYYTGRSRGFYYYPRDGIMADLKDDPENMALIAGRQGAAVGAGEWNLAYVARGIVDLNIFYRGGGKAFPLRVRDKTGAWYSNIQESALKAFAKRIGESPAPQEVFDYIYGVLNSPSYRARAAEFLKSDFPTIPLPASADSFRAISGFGAEIRQLHMLEHEALRGRNGIRTTYPIPGSNVVNQRKFADGKLWINESQYIGGVSEKAWTYRIGGYQVLDKWLKDRKGRALSGQEVAHLQRVITAIDLSVKLQATLTK